MEKKQTAVEWLKDILGDYGCNTRVDIDWKTLDGLIEQAKAMEKEQFEKELISFFLFIRNSGEHFIGMSIEQFVKYYLEKK